MAESNDLPSGSERQEFARKLGELRQTLAPTEQRLLDSMVIAAFRPLPQGDVEGYDEGIGFFTGPQQFVPSTSSPNPWWYHGSGTAAWDQTTWGTTYITRTGVH
jgi:hypothetical protein